MPFCLGVWGSAFAASVDEIFLKTAGSGLSFLDCYRGNVNNTGAGRHPDLPIPAIPSARALAEAQRMREGMMQDSTVPLGSEKPRGNDL